jgi:hypothetical protein
MRTYLNDVFTGDIVGSVIDLGCGSTPMSLEIDCAVRLGVDIDPHAIACMKQQLPIIKIDMIKAVELFEDQQFDLALFCDSLEHLTRNDAEWVFRTFRKIAANVFVFMPINDLGNSLDVGPHRHLSVWTKKDLEQLTESPVRLLHDYHGKNRDAMIGFCGTNELQERIMNVRVR